MDGHEWLPPAWLDCSSPPNKNVSVPSNVHIQETKVDPGPETVSAELQLQSEGAAGQNLEGREDEEEEEEEEEGLNRTDSKGTKQFVRLFQLIAGPCDGKWTVLTAACHKMRIS